MRQRCSALNELIGLTLATMEHSGWMDKRVRFIMRYPKYRNRGQSSNKKTIPWRFNAHPHLIRRIKGRVLRSGILSISGGFRGSSPNPATPPVASRRFNRHACRSRTPRSCSDSATDNPLSRIRLKTSNRRRSFKLSESGSIPPHYTLAFLKRYNNSWEEVTIPLSSHTL